MKSNFVDALDHVLKHEGGYSDHPQDPGGATMKGVTLAVFQRFYGQDKDKNDLRNISDEQCQLIYRTGYWDKCCCDDLPSGVDYCVFDAAVNSGPARSAKWLQGTIGALQDGGIGANTLAKVTEHNPMQIVDDCCDRRLSFLKGLATWNAFGKGWERRVENVRLTGIALSSGVNPKLDEVLPQVQYDIIKLGSQGPWVSKLQSALELNVDGIFGKKTQVSLIAWQSINGIEQDGVAGRTTYRALGLLG
jgi:lysozyme family protein